MAEKFSVQQLTLIATAALVAETFTTWAGAVPTAGAVVAGVAASAASAGQPVPVQLLGTAIVTSGGAFAAGAALSSDASGNAIAQPGAAPNQIVARAIDAATGAGQRVRVQLIPN